MSYAGETGTHGAFVGSDSDATLTLLNRTELLSEPKFVRLRSGKLRQGLSKRSLQKDAD